MANPYMGTMMLQCGTPAFEVDPPDHLPTEDQGHYTCSMHPSVKQEHDGLCPLCNMTLTYVDPKEAWSGTVVIDGIRRQKLGIWLHTVQVETQKRVGTLWIHGHRPLINFCPKFALFCLDLNCISNRKVYVSTRAIPSWMYILQSYTRSKRISRATK